MAAGSNPMDDIMAVSLQCGATIQKVVFEKGKVNIYIEGAERLVSLERSEIEDWDLQRLKKEMGLNDKRNDDRICPFIVEGNVRA